MIFGIDERPPIRPAAYGEGGEVYSYGRLCADAARVAACTPGRPLVFSFCENSYGALCGYAGFLSGGAVPLLLDAGMHRELLDGLLETYRPGFLWLPERMAGGFPGTKRLLSMEGYVLLGRGEAPPAMHPGLALLLTTSGSTGSPKLVRQSRRNIESNARAIVRYLEIGEEERAITTLPMNYTYGLSIVQSHLLAGASLILTGRSVVEPEFWALFREREATSFGGVPYTYEILKRVGFFGMELPSLRYFTQAGGKLPPELHETCARYADARGKRFYVMYGQTEATARMGYLPWERALEKRGCMGIAIPGGRFTLLDVDGAAIDSPGEVGELRYEGDNVTMGYAECAADLAKGDERRGVLLTGDMAARDEEGFYTIVGRKKRFIKLFGSRVSLDGCERLVKEQFPGVDCACFGRDDALCVCLTDPALPERAADRLAELLGVRRRAVSARYVREIPRSGAGKILYRELEEAP